MPADKQRYKYGVFIELSAENTNEVYTIKERECKGERIRARDKILLKGFFENE